MVAPQQLPRGGTALRRVLHRAIEPARRHCYPPFMPPARPEPAPLKKIGNLRMIWRRALRYKGKIAADLLSLLIAASATLAIPDGFRRVIDEGFGAQGADITPHFYYLLFIVIVLAFATAGRFYFVSMLGERVVADIRAD